MRTATLAAAGFALLVVIAAGVAVLTGAGPLPGGADDREALTDFPTGTPFGAAIGTSGQTAGSSTPPFSFTIASIEECGQTCREVTVSLHNQQETAASDVTVFTRIYAGEDNTDPDDLVWEGRESVGTLEAGASTTTTKRVELSFQEALAVDQNGGWVTVVTTVRTSERTVTFRDVEQVA